MGAFPKIKRRCFCPSSVAIATVLSFLILWTFLFARPTYLERLPDVLLPQDSASEDGKKEGEAIVDDSGKVVQATTTTSVIPTRPSRPVSQKNKGWKFDSARDARAYNLDAEQCQIAFPGLFAEIDRGVEARNGRGNITAEEMDISDRDNGALHGMILDQQVRVAVTLYMPHALLL